MALADITLADGQSTPVNHTFTYISSVDNKVVRSWLTASPEEPLILTFGHMVRKFGTYAGKGHLARFDLTKLDADNVTQHTANIRVMADIPDRILSDALAKDMAAYTRNLLTEAFFLAFVRGSNG
jgi:hypothetical protein